MNADCVLKNIEVLNIKSNQNLLDVSACLIVLSTQEKKVKFGIIALLPCLGVLFINGFGSMLMQLFL